MLLATPSLFRRMLRDPSAVGVECEVYPLSEPETKKRLKDLGVLSEATIEVLMRSYESDKFMQLVWRLPRDIIYGYSWDGLVSLRPRDAVYASEEWFNKHLIPEGTSLVLKRDLTKRPVRLSGILAEGAL